MPARSTTPSPTLIATGSAAPITGTILTKKADIGSLVSPMSFNVAALPVSMSGMVNSFNTPPTTVGTAIVMYSLGVSGFVMLGVGGMPGTEATRNGGPAALANGGSGISLTTGSGLTVGPSTSASTKYRNVISGNTVSGIAASVSVTIRGNYIGVDSTGNGALGNGFNGIYSGGSAGGNLTAMVALTADDPQFANPYDDPHKSESVTVSVAVPNAASSKLIAASMASGPFTVCTVRLKNVSRGMCGF